MRLIIYALLGVVFSLPVYSQTAPLTGVDDPEAIADLVVTSASNDIAQAWLIAPTQRYPHFVRGQRYEAGGIRIQITNGSVLSLLLDDSFVFEDRTPRLADLDRDGRDEIVLVLTSAEFGSALAAYGVVQGRLELRARTPFIGRAFRWLNPSGIGDYDGDGQLDVALVQKPHLDKEFEIWTLVSGEFRRIGRLPDVSNHQNGSPATGLAASADFDGDGIVDIALVSGNYEELRIMSFANRQWREILSQPLPAAASGDFLLAPTSEGWRLSIPLANGNIFEITVPELSASQPAG